MKKMILIMTMFILASCGVETTKVEGNEILAASGLSCLMDEKFVGQWVNDNVGEVLTIVDDCTLGTDQCHVVGAATMASEIAGMLTLIVKSSDGGSCLPIGAYSCGYFLELNNTKLRLSCDGKSFYYTRK